MILIIGLLALLLLAAPRLIAILYAREHSTPLDSAPNAPVAIVFGAGLWRDGSPTPVLQDRVATAAELYFTGRVEKILMSGDNRFLDYNEPGAMKTYALRLGVPEDAIVLDYAGRRTYDTCYRARSIFGVKNALIVTQNFHLPRAIFLCRFLGISATGVSADRRIYRPESLFWWGLREFPATLASVWDVFIAHPVPVLGDPEPIFPDG